MPFLRSPQGISWLLAALAVVVYVFFRCGSGPADSVPGPGYDLLFAVHTFDTSRKDSVSLYPYVIDGTLHLQVEKLAPGEEPGSVGLVLYRYDHHTGRAVPLPLPSAQELRAMPDKTAFVFGATQRLALSTNDTSPDGYSLAEPNWVKVGPLQNLLGNIALLLMTGKTDTIKERESAPRLANQAGSVAIKSKSPLFSNEAETAILLGWVVPDRPTRPGQQP